MVGCLGMGGTFGNPASSSHAMGLRARQLVEDAREEVATLIGADADEIIWTRGAIESNNLALEWYSDIALTRRNSVTSLLEHKAILDTIGSLEKRGLSVNYLRPSSSVEITAEVLGDALGADTGIVSLMLVNNELGTLPNIAAMSHWVWVNVDTLGSATAAGCCD